MRLEALFIRIRIGDDLFYTGDDILMPDVQIEIGEEARSSSIRFNIHDPKLAIGGKYQAISFSEGGILVPPDLLQDPTPPPSADTAIAATSVQPGGSVANQDEAIRLIIAECQRQGITDPNQIAYVLATAQHESTFAPIEEYASGEAYEGRSDLGNTQPGDGVRYKGRGFVQLTGRVNYERYSQLTGQDLVGNPDLALDPNIAAFILVDGMRNGTFTGASLNDYIPPGGSPDFANARRIINGTDRADLIASYAQEWQAKLPQYLGGANMMPASQPTTSPTLEQAQPLVESSFKGTEIICECGFDPFNLIAFHFVHCGTTSAWTESGHFTTFEGKSVRWLLTRVPQTRSFENLNLREVTEEFTAGFGVTTEFNAEPFTYSHLDMTGQTPFQLLQREGRSMGFRIADNPISTNGGNPLAVQMEPVGNVQFTNFVIEESIFISGQFNDQARAANMPNPNSLTSIPDQGADTTGTTLDRDTGEINQIDVLDLAGTDAGEAGGLTTGTGVIPVTGVPAPEGDSTSSGGASPAAIQPGETQEERDSKTETTTNDEGTVTDRTTETVTYRSRGQIRTVTTVTTVTTEEGGSPETTVRITEKIETASGTTTNTTAIDEDGEQTFQTRQSSQVNDNVFDTISPEAAAYEGPRDQWGLPQQQPGAIDLQDGTAEPAALVDESQRVRGFESSCEILLNQETLLLVPGQVVGFSSRLFPPPFNREWRIGNVRHSLVDRRTSLTFYTPQAPPPNSTSTTDGVQLASAAPGGWILPCGGITGDGLGPRPGRAAGYLHKVLDIANDQGTPILAINSGVVDIVVDFCAVGDSACGGYYGNYVAVKHDGGYYSLYAHLHTVAVKVGDQVQTGQTVGTMGTTGSSTGPHLHILLKHNETAIPLSKVGLVVPEPYTPGFEY